MNIDLEHHLCFKLYVASRLIVQSFAEVFTRLDLTYPKYLVLAALIEKDGQTVSELGRRLFLDSGTLSPLLKSLESKGYIKRQRSQWDDRIVDNFLTNEGRSVHGEAMTGAAAIFCRTEMSAQQFSTLGLGLDDFIARCQVLLETQEESASNAANSHLRRIPSKSEGASRDRRTRVQDSALTSD